MYDVFTRTWWRENRNWPDGLEPCPGERTYIHRNVKTEEQARQLCADHRETHEPGRLSFKAEYESQ